MRKRKTGFTLIEMMIVVAIIGILAGVLINVININRIQARSRNSRRIGDVKSIQTAMELYFSNFRVYPPDADNTGWVPPATVLTEEYMASVPVDPKNGETPAVVCFGDGTTYGYYYKKLSGGKYILGATMEVDASPEGNRCTATDVPNCGVTGSGCVSDPLCYCVQNPL